VVGLLNQSYGNSIFNTFEELFSIKGVLIYISTSNVQEPLFSTTSPFLVIFCLFDTSHSYWRKVTSHCGFDLYLPDQ
jgi:hypothetical protein